MENKESYLEFVSSESYKQQIDVWYRTYNISYEKTLLFYDFVVSLYYLIEDTYLGEDIINNESDQMNHFNWCWDKTLENFAKEKIFFKERESCYHYFWNFFYEAYYMAKIENQEIRIMEYFYRLFDFSHRKTRSELDMLTDVYKIFEQNLKN
jgi:hypothetical protein